MTMDAMECMGRQALACFVGTTESEHKGHFYSTHSITVKT